MRIISETEFRTRITTNLLTPHNLDDLQAVTGPGRSGAVAAVYASHILRVPLIAFGSPFLGKILIVDMVEESGRTIRKAQRRYSNSNSLTVFNEPPRGSLLLRGMQP